MMGNIDRGLQRARARGIPLRRVDSDGAAEDDSAAEDPVFAPTPTAPLNIDALESVLPDRRLLARNRIVTDELSAASSAYKMLRTRVLQRMRRNRWKTIGITGTCSAEGKSLTAINLSIMLARDLATNVVLVDMDLRKPSIHRQLGISHKYGVGDYLRGAAGLEEVAVRPGVARLGVILNERVLPNSSEILASRQTSAMVDRIKQGPGRIAIFDLPPLLATDDMLAFSPVVDSVLMVLAQRQTKRADVTAARELLQGVNVLGAVLNRSSDKMAPYYYSYAEA